MAKAKTPAASPATPPAEGADNAPPPAPPEAEQKKPAKVVNDIRRIEQARALPVITGDAATSKPEVAEGAIERFMAGEDDRRVMAIVAYKGALAAVHIADEPQAENAE